MHTLFHLHPTPDKAASKIVHFMYSRLLQRQQQQQTSSEQSDVQRVKCSTAELSRFLFVLGQVALNSLVYIEHIAGYAKKAAILSATNPNPNPSHASANNASMINSTFDSASMNSSITLPTPLVTPATHRTDGIPSSASFVGGEKAVNAMEEEMDTAAAVDAEQERVT